MLLSRVRFRVSVLLARAAILDTVRWGGGGLWKLNWGSGSRVREFGCSFASDVIISIALLKSSPMFGLGIWTTIPRTCTCQVADSCSFSTRVRHGDWDKGMVKRFFRG